MKEPASREKRQQHGRASVKKRNSPASRSTSPVIPILVGVVVVAIIAGAVVSLEKRRPAGTALSKDATAGPLPTISIPYPNVPRMPLQEVRDKLEQGAVILVDVRSKASYDEAHATGALSLPEEEVDTRLGELPRDKALVLY